MEITFNKNYPYFCICAEALLPEATILIIIDKNIGEDVRSTRSRLLTLWLYELVDDLRLFKNISSQSSISHQSFICSFLSFLSHKNIVKANI